MSATPIPTLSGTAEEVVLKIIRNATDTDLTRTQPHKGWDNDFIGDVEESSVCPMCFMPFRDPVQTLCGHKFCLSCFLAHVHVREADGLPPDCPIDREEIDFTRLNADNATKKQVKRLMIACTSNSKGCEWKGSINDFILHENTCDFQMMECPHDCGCDAFTRRDLRSHLDNCTRTPTPCIYCKQLVHGDDMKRHLEVI